MSIHRDRGRSRSQRTFAYCHDSVGIGHFRRTLTISERIRRRHPGSTFLLATGTPYVPLFDLPYGVDYIKMPALAKQECGAYRGKYLDTSTERMLRCREALLLSAVQTFDPDVVLVDKAPAGVCEEFLPALRWLRRHRPEVHLVFGMRDIEDDAESTVQQWRGNGAAEALEECYDEIWVYGMPEVFDVVSEYQLSCEIQNKLSYTGYVVRERCGHILRAGEEGRQVLVTVGGGTDGERLLRTYLDHAAKTVSARGLQSTVVGGPDLPAAQRCELRGRAEQIPGTRWLDQVTCMSCCIRRAAAAVTMGGYNTLSEVVSGGCSAVVVPRIQPRREQFIRATRWAERADLQVLDPETLTPERLSECVAALLDRGTNSPAPDLNFGGLQSICHRFDTFWKPEVHGAAAVRVH